jgi:hypothetical protein
MYEISQLYVTMTKIHAKINLKEERLILAHSFVGFSSWLLDSIAIVLRQVVQIWSPHDGQQAEGKRAIDQGQNIHLQGTWHFSNKAPPPNHPLSYEFTNRLTHW